MPARSPSFVVPVAALAIAVAVPTVIAVGAPSMAVPNPTSTVFLNELHYDNVGTDAGETIEIAGPAGTNLAGWSIELHNGEAATSTLYNTLGLGGVIPDQGGGHGTIAFTYPVNGIQNGPRDGVALVGPGSALVQFLSYEGVLTANSGAAAGSTSTDIGVSEPTDSPVGSSLQLAGTGSTYGDFTWSPPAAGTFGAVNTGQTFSTDTTSSSSTSSTSTTTTTLPPGPCPVPPEITPIATVQGNTDVTPCAGRPVLIDGVVVGDYEGPSPTLRGFYVQEQDGEHDGDPATSEGIFVFNGNNDSVDLGDVVQVLGTVSEFQGQTQVSAQSITVIGEDATVTAAPAALPVPDAAHFERFEGMLTSFEQPLTVTEHFQLGRFGMVVVSGGGRLPQPTTIAEPGPPARAVAAANALNRLIVDDALQNQNPDPILFGRGGEPLSAGNTLRGGDTVTGLVGVMTYTWAGNAASGNAYRIRPINDLSDLEPDGGVPNFTADNPRPAAAPDVGGSLHIANFNVLNYFLTLDVGTAEVCGPVGFEQECRGAETPAEFERQRVKLLAALTKLDADIVGLIELENTPGVEPLADIVAGLNALPGDDYAFIDTDTIGTDAIRVGLIYKPAVVSPIGDWKIINESVDPRFDTSRNRPSLAQSFVETASGEVLTVVVNHLKSKNCGGETGGDIDDGDGHGCFNATRTAAAQALRDWVASRPTGIADGDVVLLGDLNSNAKEDPIDVFVNAGFVDLAARFGATYSFVFDGQWGSLDYALATRSLNAQATGSADYHINSDEPSVLDYNTNFKSTGQIASLFAPDEFRTSDHDPVVSGFAPDSLTIDDAVIVLRRGGGGTVALSGSIPDELTACPRLRLRIDRVQIVDVTTTRVGRSPVCLSLTSRGLVTYDLRNGGFAAALSLPGSFTLADNTVEFGLEVNGDARVIVRQGRRVGQVWIAHRLSEAA